MDFDNPRDMEWFTVLVGMALLAGVGLLGALFGLW
jgi:hypothetical protein